MYFAEEIITEPKLPDHSLSDHMYISKYSELDDVFGSMDNFPKIRRLVVQNPNLIPTTKIMLNLGASR